MSYILEALKRSEQERKQQLRPGSFDPEGGILHLRKRQTPVWVYLLAIVLLLNLGLMVGLYWDKLSAPEDPVVNETVVVNQRSPTVQPPVIETPSMTAMPTRRQPDQITVVEDLTEPLPAAQTNFSETEAFTYIEPAVQDEPVQQVEPEQAKQKEVQDGVISDETEAWDIVAPASGSSAAEEFPSEESVQSEPMVDRPVIAASVQPKLLADSTPLLQELDAGFISVIPALGFNSHIFSQSPDARRVMINNIYLREGDGVSGLTVLEIGEQYVVFEKQGRRFKLPVMKDWNP